jgi:Mrp family chromosome partitioning ATPase
MAAAVGAVAWFIVAEMWPPEYRATTWLQVGLGTNESPAVDIASATRAAAAEQAQLLTAARVLEPAMRKVSWSDAASFRERLAASVIPGTSIIAVSFRDTDPERATRALTAVAETFIERSKSYQLDVQARDKAELDARLAAIHGEIASLDSDVARRRAELSTLPDPSPARTAAQAQLLSLELSRQLKQQTLQSVEAANLDALLAAADTRTISVVQPASAAPKPDPQRPFRYAVIGALLGALLMWTTSQLARRLDRRARKLYETAVSVGVGGVAAVGRAPTGPGPLFVRERSASAEADDVRALRLSLVATGDARSLLVTSALPLEGRSLLAANLALASAEAGTVTVLVDADLNRPRQDRNFGIDPVIGLGDLLARPDSIRRSLPAFKVDDGLYVIPAQGSPPGSRADLYEPGFDVVVRELSAATGGVTIVDGGPLLGDGDGLALVRAVDAVIVVADPSRSRPEDLRTTLELLKRAGRSVASVVLNGVDRPTLHLLKQRVRVRTEKRTRPKLAESLLLTWAALLGVQFGAGFVSRFNVAISDFILAVLLVVVVADPKLRQKAFALPPLLLAFFGTMGVALTIGLVVDAWTIGYLPTDAWLNKALGLPVLAAVVGCVRAVADTRQSIMRLARALVLGAIVSCALAMALWLGGIAGLLPRQEVRFSGFLTNPNGAALYYMVGILWLVAGFAGAPLGLPRPTRIVGALVLGLGCIFTISLSAVAGGLAAFVVLLLGLRRGRRPAIFALLAIVVFSIPAILSAVSPAGVEGDVFQQAAASRQSQLRPDSSIFDAPLALLGNVYSSSVVAAKGSSVFERLVVDVLGLDLWTNDVPSVITGVGLGAFVIRTNAYGGTIIHNSYIWVAVELGIVGLIALLLLHSYLASVAVGLLRGVDRSIAVTIIATFLLFMVWWLFNEGLYQRAFWLHVAVASTLVQLARPAYLRDVLRLAPTSAPSPIAA